jgi:hypothetical protein
MKWNYSVSTNTIWTSFDYGIVEANTKEEAKQKALKQLRYDFEKANTVLAQADVTQGFQLSFNESQIEISIVEVTPSPKEESWEDIWSRYVEFKEERGHKYVGQFLEWLKHFYHPPKRTNNE